MRKQKNLGERIQFYRINLEVTTAYGDFLVSFSSILEAAAASLLFFSLGFFV